MEFTRVLWDDPGRVNEDMVRIGVLNRDDVCPDFVGASSSSLASTGRWRFVCLAVACSLQYPGMDLLSLEWNG